MSKQEIEPREARVVGVFSGKGGVGKSVFCVNFSIALGQLNRRVLIIDLDVGMGNIEQLLGEAAPHDITDCIHDRLQLADAVVRGPDNISFIPGGNGLSEIFRMSGQNLRIFLEQLDRIKTDYEYIIFDFGAGVTDGMLSFILAVHQMILITTPEPPAVADAYSALKIICSKNSNIPISCVVNQVSHLQEGKQTWLRLSEVAKRFIGVDIKWLSALHRDGAVVRSVREQVPCIVRYPHARLSSEMRLLARAFLVQSQDGQSVVLFSSFLNKVRKYFEGRGGK